MGAYTIIELLTIVGVFFTTGLFCYTLYYWINR